MSNNTTSTFQSVVDSTIGTAQSLVGSITGNTSQENQGTAKQDKAEVENTASHTAAKLGPFTATGEGGVAKDSSKRQEGAWDQTVGAAKETVGGLVGAEGLKQEGHEQNLAGRGQEAEGQIDDFAGGASKRFVGALGGAVSGVTGDRAAQQEYQQQHDDGKAQQRGAEIDIQKQNP